MPVILPEKESTPTLERRNLELKARVSDIKSAENIAVTIKANYESVLYQTDTYFHCPTGRLKLREISQDNAPPSAELIFYNRPDEESERWSRYYLVPVPNPCEMKILLAESNGLRGVVEKTRTLYLWNGCRIHLDQVTNLGNFLEFEVVSTGDTNDDQQRMDYLIDAFEIDLNDAIAGSYSDLLGL